MPSFLCPVVLALHPYALLKSIPVKSRGPVSCVQEACWRFCVHMQLWCSFGELLHQTALTGGPLNMQKRGGYMGADGMWRGLLREMDRDGL